MSHVMIEPYPHYLGGHCGSGALRDLLHWADLGWEELPGRLPGEGLVFGLGGRPVVHVHPLSRPDTAHVPGGS